MKELLEWMTYFILTYFIALQIYTAFMAWLSYRELRTQELSSSYGRVNDMLASPTTPPVSIIMPAYNESAGIVEAVRSMSMVVYPKIEIIVVNDGSTDNTLQVLIDAFEMIPVHVPSRPEIKTEEIRQIYRSTLPISVQLVDKDNGGKGDALNAGINLAKYPYFLATDADVVLDDQCLVAAMHRVMEDKGATIAVGGNVRLANGCQVDRGRIRRVGLPKSIIEMSQLLEYIRSFLASRPGFSRINSLLLVSGALGLFQKRAVLNVGGFLVDHLGEDLEITMRLHKYMREQKQRYRVVYSPDAVAWTEVPAERGVLRQQRIRWHRGFIQVIAGYLSMIFNPKYGVVGMFGWPAFIFFEFLAPIIEFIGWFIVPLAFYFGYVNLGVAIPLVAAALLFGLVNTFVALILDEKYGHYNSFRHTLSLLKFSFLEQMGARQQTVFWRVRSLLWNTKSKAWGEMQRSGVGNLE